MGFSFSFLYLYYRVFQLFLNSFLRPNSPFNYDVSLIRLGVEAGRLLSVSLFFSRASLRKPHSTWSPCQNSSDWPKNSPKRMDIAEVIERLEWTISLITRGATPMARAMAFCETPMGLRYSSSRISPGVIGLSMSISSSIMALLACPVVAVPPPIAMQLLGWYAYQSAQCGPFPS